MDLKETFNKGVAWVKSHPWAAGGILLLVLVIAWWISKQAGNTGAGAGTSDAATSEAPPDLSAGIGGGTGGGLLDSFQNSLDSNPPVGQTVDNTSSIPMMKIPAAESLPLIESPALFDTGALPEAFYQPPTETMAQTLESSTALGGGGGLGFFTGSVVDVMPNPTASNESAVKKTTSSGKQTDSQKVGKGKKFTGWVDGQYYVNGSKAAPTSIASQTKMAPSTNSSGNFFSGNVSIPGY